MVLTSETGMHFRKQPQRQRYLNLTPKYKYNRTKTGVAKTKKFPLGLQVLTGLTYSVRYNLAIWLFDLAKHLASNLLSKDKTITMTGKFEQGA